MIPSQRHLCIWLPNWPIQRHRQQQAERAAELEDSELEDTELESAEKNLIANAPVLIWSERPPRGRMVVACCPVARRLGVKVGTPIAQAAELCAIGTLERGNEYGAPVIEKHDVDEDREAFERLAEMFQNRLTPLVAIESLDAKPWSGHPRHQCESLIANITGGTHLFGGEAELLHAVARDLDAMNLAACMAIADHGATAWAVAHEAPWAVAHEAPWVTTPPENLPPRSFIVRPGEAQSAISRLPVRALRIEQATVDTLARLGVESIGHLLKLPRSGLAPRLGMPLVRRIEQALGEIDEPIGVHRVEAEHCETWDLEYPTMDQGILVDRARRLLERIKGGLATHKRGAQRIVCRLDLSVHPPLILEIGLFAPTTDVDHIGGLFANRLESFRLRSDVTRLTMSVSLSAPLRTTQVSLFQNASSTASPAFEGSGASPGASLGRLVDLLSGRLGRDRVVDVRLGRDPLPENAFDVSPLAGKRRIKFKSTSPANRRRGHSSFRSSGSDKFSGKGQFSGKSVPIAQDYDFRDSGMQWDESDMQSSALLKPTPSDAMRRPLSLLSSPMAMEVALSGGSFCREIVSPELPDRLKVNGVAYRIENHWGPERIETGWWSGSLVCRDYYRVQAVAFQSSGFQWWWIYRGDAVSWKQKPFVASRGAESNHAIERKYHWFLHGRFS